MRKATIFFSLIPKIKKLESQEQTKKGMQNDLFIPAKYKLESWHLLKKNKKLFHLPKKKKNQPPNPTYILKNRSYHRY